MGSRDSKFNVQYTEVINEGSGRRTQAMKKPLGPYPARQRKALTVGNTRVIPSWPSSCTA